jgi:hypothetical protein
LRAEQTDAAFEMEGWTIVECRWRRCGQIHAFRQAERQWGSSFPSTAVLVDHKAETEGDHEWGFLVVVIPAAERLHFLEDGDGPGA